MSELNIQAKDLLEGTLFELSFSKAVFGEEEISLDRSSLTSKEDFIQKAFSVSEVKEIFFKSKKLKVKLNKKGDWKVIAKFLADYIRIHQEKILSESFYQNYSKIKGAQINEVVSEAQTLIDEQIAPALGAHGGNVSVEGFDQGKLYLLFGGGCQGCSQISATLKDGIEKILMAKLPSIKEIIDLTDHGGGENPYFK